MTITLYDIMEKSKPHFSGMGGRQTIISNGKVLISIVGGHRGLYGDFVDTFELAIMDNKSRDFITKLYYPDSNDDVLAYLEGHEVEEIVNLVFKDKSFRFL